MKVLLIQIDGSLPNMALMRLSAWHKSRGDEVRLIRPPKPTSSRRFDDAAFHGSIQPEFLSTPDKVFASTIFSKSAARTKMVKQVWPEAVVGGTGLPDGGLGFNLENIGVSHLFHDLDYSVYPDFSASIGFSQRGCRLKCKWCVVPGKEGANVENMNIGDIWRGGDNPKHIHLLDNDFFGQSEWRARCDELLEGKFKVCFSQGINIRLFNKEQAEVLASLNYRDGKFDRKRIYTAWDNLGHEKIFFNGVDRLLACGVLPAHIMVYMLIGFAPDETEKQVLYRIGKLKDAGLLPFPMPYIAPGVNPETDPKYRRLRDIQRWVVRKLYHFVPWEDYKKKPASYPSLVEKGGENDGVANEGWLHENA